MNKECVKKIRIIFLFLILFGYSKNMEGKNITFSKGEKVNTTISGNINNDGKKDYVVEYSNVVDMDYESYSQMAESLYEKGKNSKCLRIMVSEGKGYRNFDSCKLVIPLEIKGNGGIGVEEAEYMIKNNMIVIIDRNMEGSNGFTEYYTRLSYKNNKLVVKDISYDFYEKVVNLENEIDIEKRKGRRKIINKPLEDFNIDDEFYKLVNGK